MGNSLSPSIKIQQNEIEIYSKSFMIKPTQVNSQKNFFYNNIHPWIHVQPITQDHTIML